VIAESRTLEEAAARLGINATTPWRRRKRYGIAPTPAPGRPDETSDPDRDDSRT